MQSLLSQDVPRVCQRTGASLLASFCHPRRAAHTLRGLARPLTCTETPERELRSIRFRKGLSFNRKLRRSRHVAPPVVEAVADVEQQSTWAAVRRALDHRRWTPRGKGLVLLNVLVRRYPRVGLRHGR
jgi:hypothetical protein